MKNSTTKIKTTYYVLGILFLFVSWFVVSAIFQNNYIVPTIKDSALALWDLLRQGYTYKVLGFTLLRLLIAISICFILGVSLAVLSNRFYRFQAFVKPTITLLKTLPIAVVIIFLLVMFDRENAPYFIVSVVVLPLIYEATLMGLENIDKSIKDEIKLLTKPNFYVFSKVYLPITFPFILTSLIQSVGLGLKVLVMAEYLSQPKYSIGAEIIYYQDIAVKMEYVYAWSIILVIFVLVVEFILIKLSKKNSVNV